MEDNKLCLEKQPLSDELLNKMNAYWRAANYLSAGQLYLLDNPLLKKPLTMDQIKKKIVGHWGTVPGQNFIYVHCNRVIKRYDLDMILLSGPGHGGNFLIANTYLEGSYSEVYPNVHFKILNNSTMDSVNAVKEGKVDLAFVSTDLQVNKPLRMKKLREYHEVLIGGSRYIELKGRKISLEELSTYPWISLTSEALTRKFLNNYFADHGLQFLPDMELATTDLILPAVRHNLGIGFVPEEFAEEEKKAENVFEIEVEEKLPTRNIILIYDTEYPQSIASKEFQKFLSSQKN